MESINALIAAALFLVTAGMSFYIIALRIDNADAHRRTEQWRDGYSGLLEEHTNLHLAMDALRISHSELQDEYRRQGRDLTVALNQTRLMR